jgi:hypothetical protein
VRRDSLRNFCAVKGKEGLSAQQASRYVQGTKEAFMKQMKKLPKLETRTVALLTGLAIGLAIAVHDIFFVVAALIVLAAPIESAVYWMYEHVTHGTLEHRHP